MSYCYYIKPSEDIPIELLNKYNISTKPVMFREDSSLGKGDVAKRFIGDIVEAAKNIEKLLQTNVPLTMTMENNKTHSNIADLGIYPFCKSKLNDNNLPVRDHNHLTGQYRHTFCNHCNLKMQQPKFILCFFHNLSGYDSHFLITQLGYDTHSINVIPNTEEECI